ncbi:RNA polymerase sigma-70 factor [Pedobacter frigoris]|uniref:RNA polymerase sigma factor n=1 Tax=Pedobacter frigoris TaxID=2571272 RepID=UPI002930DABF|nr:RNA polymerase sigma-70 factor [Pedobacter frigoris]
MAAYSTYTDQELIALMRHGDERAFNVLFEHHQQLVFSIAMKMTHSRSQAKEVVQDVFLKVWIKRGELDGVENFGAYLNRTARNQSIDALRRIAREALRTVELKEEQLENGDDLTEQMLNYHEMGGIIAQAVETLSPQQRKVYQLCHEQGLKYEEAASQLGLSAGTVHTHMKVALGNIRKYLKNMDAMLVLILLMNK